MNITIINQHSKNQGDVAAAKSLIYKINENSKHHINIIYNMPNEWDSKYNIINDCNNISPGGYNKVIVRLIMLYFKYPFKIIEKVILLSKNVKKEFMCIMNSDIVINAPGGCNLGIYKDYRYLWRLYICKKYNIPYYIYSISIGPFNNDNFRKLSIEVLDHAKFLSLRDKNSYNIAEENNLSFIKSIDTAFLRNVNNVIPVEINNFLKNKKYCIFVPNELYKWHRKYKKYSKQEFIKLYLSVINSLSKNYDVIVMLPQLFGQEDFNDILFFNELKKENNKIIVIDDKYDSDVQQLIIRGSNLVVGGRYHSIVFAINNNVNFISLSYEPKMIDMLNVLNLSSQNIEIKSLLDNDKESYKQLTILINSDDSEITNIITNTAKKARSIASDTFKKFSKESKIDE